MIPPKSEIKTFLEYSAKNIATSEGSREKIESSINLPRTHLQVKSNLHDQTFHDKVHTLFLQPL